jgi:hypothetical protein
MRFQVKTSLIAITVVISAAFRLLTVQPNTSTASDLVHNFVVEFEKYKTANFEPGIYPSMFTAKHVQNLKSYQEILRSTDPDLDVLLYRKATEKNSGVRVLAYAIAERRGWHSNELYDKHPDSRSFNDAVFKEFENFIINQN